MKKIISLLIILVLAGCAGLRNSQPVFDHTIIKQINIKNPSFTLAVENDVRNYYLNDLENAFIKNKITLYSEESQIVNSETRSKGVALNNMGGGKLGLGVVSGKSVNAEKTINLDRTNATCIYILDVYTWTFKVISADTRELLMKGRIINDFDKEISKMYLELTGQ
jgi:hypothetical protein